MIQRLLLTALITALLVVPTTHSTSLPQFQKTRNFYLSVAMGLVPGYSFIEKFGENPDIDSTTFEDVWDVGGNYASPTATSLHNVVSTLAGDAGTVVTFGEATGGSFTTLIDADADFVSTSVAVGDVVLNDTTMMIGVVSAVTNLHTLTMIGQMRNPNSGLPRPYPGVLNTSTFAQRNAFGDAYRIVRDASTGASVLHILGLGAAFTVQEEFVVLNGVGVVATDKTWAEQYRARIFTTDSIGAVGVITSTAQSGGAVSVQVVNGANQSLMTPFTCAIDTACYIVSWWASMSKAVATAVSDVHLMGGTLNGVRYELQTRSINTTGSSGLRHPYPIPIPIPPGSAVWVSANSTAQNTGVAAGFTVLVVDIQ